MRRRNGRALICPVLLCCAAFFGATTPAAIATTQDEPPFPSRRDPWLPEWMMREPGGPGPMTRTMMARMFRHATFLNIGVPEEYDSARSTVKPTPDVITEGRTLYRAQCASCHGNRGRGDGDAGKTLSPSPAVLAYMITRPISVDTYLLWTIADGGAQFESDMPAFKDKLTREEIWKIIAYMRSGFPDAETKPGDP